MPYTGTTLFEFANADSLKHALASYLHYFFRLLLPLFLLMLTSACITQRLPLSESPVETAHMFATCSGEGSGMVTLKNGEIFQGMAAYDWHQQGAEWEVTVVGSFGEEWLYLKHEQSQDNTAVQKLHCEGRLQAELAFLKIGKDGYFTWDNHFIALKPEELGCFMQGKAPQSWLSHLKGLYKAKDAAYFLVDDGKREIKLKYYSADKQCWNIVWGGFLGLFKNSIEFCIFNDRIFTLRGINSHQLQFTKEPL